MLDNQMFIPKPIENRDTCFICGRKAETVEHVIPKWLQHRYNLWDEHLLLPNKTSIPYRNVLVPSCAKCNNEVYGSLENRVSSGIATESDIWKWANKIHYALGYKDRFLAWDRANPNYKIGDIISSNDPIERDRHFLHCVSGDFHTDPDPFGSVFKFEFAKFSEFAFAHIIHSQSISVCLGNIGYVIFVTDGQALKRDVGLTQYYNSFPKPVKREDMLFFHANCIEMLARHELGQDIMMSNNFLVRVGKTVVHHVEPPNKERFRSICRSLGLQWVDSDELK
ncbi:MAG: hypothetical protein A2499_08895 [Stygiobacter sp. RIFOXYC12_FULL_38_8]|nr:MAG: hypothetical protein A2X62_11035 [Stygiobacter sp. GWC2_38_9]OGU82256.1 MAG: hypothetical protein A2279_02760 [Stygiobacter sp. RIFOXYA12_FULL_38_9]OGV08352.1 MAG: hypothetical protein A2299_10905 [Stygiobacter sp. RIFOXYB2_FULL_37_11]OGV13125.1 MAG: hypothetical protein A2440_12385 [Stygiobacter sp. RIFOXYC2_FULL_38_25]OGV23082.1 MAG: hypothetical protein A2499_08895 [Stygiobacter sp. RIFOXYC12_FULL_38_8]OGV83171.1 MAG: hypothetical protein A2X65_15940 [Stygiobacter sp. GWF2_38_21]